MMRRTTALIMVAVVFAGCTQLPGSSDTTDDGPQNTLNPRGLIIADVNMDPSSVEKGENTTLFMTFRNTNPDPATDINFEFDNLGEVKYSLLPGMPSFCSEVMDGGARLPAATPADEPSFRCGWDLGTDEVSMIGSSTTIPVSFQTTYHGRLSMPQTSLSFVFGDEQDTVTDHTFSNGEIRLQTTHPGHLDWGSHELSLQLSTTNTGSGQIVSGGDARVVNYSLSGPLVEAADQGGAGFDAVAVEGQDRTTCERGVFVQGARTADSTCILSGSVEQRPAPITYSLDVAVDYRYRLYGSNSLAVTSE